jgi:antitoxin (DNA-binding transcriptional repressor) of toxin-antitoxin stability system
MTPPAARVEVGIRKLRDHLSEYLSLVREGAEIVITDRTAGEIAFKS